MPPQPIYQPHSRVGSACSLVRAPASQRDAEAYVFFSLIEKRRAGRRLAQKCRPRMHLCLELGCVGRPSLRAPRQDPTLQAH